MTRAVPLVTRGLKPLLLGASAIALSACADMAAMTAEHVPAEPEAQTSKSKKSAPKKAAKAVDVPAPTAFAATDVAIWDGRPSLGAIWVAHPDAPQAERVQIVNKATGKKVAGALFTRKSPSAGPPIQMSSEAALALGVGPGQTTELEITAVRTEGDVPIQMAAAPAKQSIWGNDEPEIEPETELLLAAQSAPAEESIVAFTADVPMGVFPDYDAAVLVQARLSQAGVRSEIRETYLDEVIFYKVFAEQADTTVMVAEVAPEIAPSFDLAKLEQIVLPDQQTTLRPGLAPLEDAIELRLSDAVIVAQLTLDDVTSPHEPTFELDLPDPLGSHEKGEIAALTVASVSEGPALKPFLTFDAAVQYAGVSLATPTFSDSNGIAVPTKSHADAPQTTVTSALEKAEIAFTPAPINALKGAPGELLASITRPSAPQQDGDAHIRTSMRHDPVFQADAPSLLAKTELRHDTPAKPLERAKITVMAALGPLEAVHLDARQTPTLTRATQPSLPNPPSELTTAQPPASLPQRPQQRSKVQLLASLGANSVSPNALSRAIAPTVMHKPTFTPQPGIETAMLGDGLPTVGKTYEPPRTFVGKKLLARATPRTRTTSPDAVKPTQSPKMASILEMDVSAITDATSLELKPKALGAGVAELPNFGSFGAAQTGGDGGNWYGLNLLGSKN